MYTQKEKKKEGTKKGKKKKKQKGKEKKEMKQKWTKNKKTLMAQVKSRGNVPRGPTGLRGTPWCP